MRNCIIAGFDFGIFAIEGKRSGSSPPLPHLQNEITGNTITARFVALSLMKVDNTRIENNFLSFTTRGGRALYVGRDSDFNKIVGNNIRAKLSIAVTGATRVPGPAGPEKQLPTSPSSANPLVKDSSAVLIAHTEGPEPTLTTAVIEGKLHHLRVPPSAQPNSQFSNDNEFDNNDIRLSGDVVDAVVISIAQKTRVTNNTILGSLAAIRSGGQTGSAGLDKVFPGTCRVNSRPCVGATDCNIPLIDAVDQGPCENTIIFKVFWVGDHLHVIKNTILPPFTSGISGVSKNIHVIGNTIIGPGPSGAFPGVLGINLGSFALETAQVRGNVVSNVDTGLNLVKSFQGIPAKNFTAAVSENDFIGYVTAVLARELQPPLPDFNPYDLTTVLSNGIRGNYWGTRCGQGLDPNKVKKPDNTVNTFATDPHPYETPIARMLSISKSGDVFTPSEVNQPCGP